MRFATVTAIPGQNDHGFLWNRVTLTKIEPRNPTTFTVCWCVVPTDWCGKSSCFIPRLRKTCRQAFSLRIGSPEIMGAHQRTHYQGIFPLKKLLNPQQLLGRQGFLDVLQNLYELRNSCRIEIFCSSFQFTIRTGLNVKFTIRKAV